MEEGKRRVCMCKGGGWRSLIANFRVSVICTMKALYGQMRAMAKNGKDIGGDPEWMAGSL